MNRRYRCMQFMALVLVSLPAFSIEPESGVKVTPLARETHTWDSGPIAYPKGQPEVTSLLVEIAPGAQTGWHYHPVHSFAYVLEGTLELTAEGGEVKRLKAGEVLAEVVNRRHNGKNVGTTPVRLFVLYTGEVGTPLTVKQEEK